MSKDNVYLVAMVEKLGHAVRHAVHNNQPRNLALLQQNIERGQRIFESWMEDHGGRILLSNSDEVCAELPGTNLEDLPQLHSQVQDAWDSTITFGIGLDLKEALKACEAGKKRGGHRIVFYAPQIEEALDEESHSESHSAKKGDGDPDELKEMGLHKANSPSPGPPTPNDPQSFSMGSPASPPSAPSPFGPGSAQPSGADMPPPPSSTNAAAGLSPVEQQMHQLAAGGEADAARSEAQAQAAHAGNPDAEAIKKGISRILLKVKEQLPVLEQLRDQAPDAYQAILAMVKVVSEIGKQLSPQQEQPQEQPIAKAYTVDQEQDAVLRQSNGINNAVNYTLRSTLKEERELHEPMPPPGILDKMRKAARKPLEKRAMPSGPMPEAQIKRRVRASGELVTRLPSGRHGTGNASPAVRVFNHEEPRDVVRVNPDGTHHKGKKVQRQAQSGWKDPQNPAESMTGNRHGISAIRTNDEKIKRGGGDPSVIPEVQG